MPDYWAQLFNRGRNNNPSWIDAFRRNVDTSPFATGSGANTSNPYGPTGSPSVTPTGQPYQAVQYGTPPGGWQNRPAPPAPAFPYGYQRPGPNSINNTPPAPAFPGGYQRPGPNSINNAPPAPSPLIPLVTQLLAPQEEGDTYESIKARQGVAAARAWEQAQRAR